jgi:hypothetical protein
MGMSAKIDQFCEDLRVKLTKVESDLSQLRKRAHDSAESARAEILKHRDAVALAVSEARGDIDEGKAAAEKWAQELRADTGEKIDEWKASANVGLLKRHADVAEAHAAATLKVALDAVDEADLAAIDAWIARADADAAAAALARI